MTSEEAAISVLDTTSKKNLLLLIHLRWLAVCGQVITILFVQFWFGIPLPLAPMVAVLLFLVALNIGSLIRHRLAPAISDTELFLALILDVAALTVQLFLSGGASNPFISLYLLQITLGAALLQERLVWALLAVASGCFFALTAIYRPLLIPHSDVHALFSLHIQGMFVCFILAACLLVLFTTRINRNLRDRDARLAAMRQQSAEENLIVRMGLLASGAAHELGTPLATLSVILNDWRRMPEFKADADLLEEIGEMQSQVDRCKQIVSGILMSSGEARGEGTVRTTVNAFIDDLVAEWRSSRSPTHIDYVSAFSPDAAIISDPALKQVIFNVFDNAHEASPNWIGVTVRRHEDDLVLSVSDVGSGFDDRILAELGKPYRSSKNRPGGGLGLFLVINVVRKLGGTVKAENHPRGGASVTLTLPIASLSSGGSRER
ncbi:ATP-binding protein [Chelatococcus asaccharovorans]|uniref:histidine kinase n=1 Tax=Chelatococcus asaccharovorans TaxID=28210 RepID=A0A2V3TYF4_9HYPH|nr:ATP-binding protein [Chelatococcus asaccharovorans]PXW54091.1 two-component system sensor histidine kinase RegB [Chelatococcus asaccharovorans]CAH1649004.1 Sensor histidine kinase PrrB (RegB) [Chelatococcus asaccharovorans]CAH1691245.1 Sensor histidine kinase PrrB (RegB) [Chelatococcus asaccharovorans]